MRARGPWAFLSIGALVIAASPMLPGYIAGALVLDGVGAASVVAVVAGARRYRAHDARAWHLIAVGVAALVAGDVTWDALPESSSAAAVNVANVLYLAAYVFLGLGVFRLARARTATGDADALTDAGIVVAAALLPAWQFLVEPALDAGPPAFDTVAAIAYPFLDLLLLGVLARLLFSRNVPAVALWFVLAGIGIQVVADVSYLRLVPSAAEPEWLDLLWPASYLMFGVAALHPSIRRLTEPAPPQRSGLGVARIALLASALAVGPSLVIGQRLRGHEVDAWVAGPVALLVALLVTARLVRTAINAELAHDAVRESEERFRSLIQHATDVVSVVGATGEVLYTSPPVEQLLGTPPSVYIGTPMDDHIHPEDLAFAYEVLGHALEHPGRPYRIELRLRHRDGSWRWVDVAATNRLDEPAVGGVVCNLRDISERKQADALKAGEARVLDMIARGAPLEATLDALVETAEGQLPGRRFTVRLAADGSPPSPGVPRPSWVVPIVAAGTQQALGTFEAHSAVPGAPTRTEHALLERATALAAVAIDRAEAEDRLEHQALHDHLTGLPNRALVLDRLSQSLLRLERSPGETVAVLFLDLDRFKVINDSLGHEAGDDLLTALGVRLTRALRPGDTVARFGGDEFVMVCERLTGGREAEALADRVARGLRKPFELSHGEVVVTASIGIALSRRAADRPESLLRDADSAMYRAKDRGGARTVLFDDSMHTRAVARLLTERALRHALEHDDLDLVYQPQVHLASGACVAVEALVRWRDAVRGTVLPADFIPIAEETGLIVPIGQRVLELACAQAAEWRAAGPDGNPVGVSVNLSARQLLRADFPRGLRDVLAAHDVDPGTICVEVTESVLLDDADATVEALRALKDLGVRLAIDDFGTGYSSLSYLKRFPFDELKIDATFVTGLGRSDTDDAIVAATIDMAHALGMAAAAEGVENAGQLTRLAELGCDLAQGFYLARPEPATSLRLPPPRVRPSASREMSAAATALRWG